MATGDRVTTEDLKNTFYKTIRWGIQNISQTFTKDPEKRVFARGTAKSFHIYLYFGSPAGLYHYE